MHEIYSEIQPRSDGDRYTISTILWPRETVFTLEMGNTSPRLRGYKENQVLIHF